MSTPYTSGPHPLEDAVSPETWYEIKVPHRGTIVAIRFQQTSGEPQSCEFEVYTSRSVLPGSSSSSSGSSVSEPEPPEPPPDIKKMYSIFGQLQASLGAQHNTAGANYPYRNQDGTFSVPVNKLYVAVRPSNSPVTPSSYVLAFDILVSQLT